MFADESLHICTGWSRARHDQIVHRGSLCPLCEAVQDNLSLTDAVNDLREELAYERKKLLGAEHEQREEGAA